MSRDVRSTSKLHTLEQAVGMIHDGATLMVGGFGFSGTPLALIDTLVDVGTARDLTIIHNNCGYPGQSLGRLLVAGRIRRVIGSFFTPNPDVARYQAEGRLEVTLLPQGTLAEAIRAGGAGIPAFYTPTAAGTALAEGKEVRGFGGREYVLEHALRADVAIIKAHRADELGNLLYRKTARNFNPLMATAADLVIAEVEQLVPIGTLDPEQVVTPHFFVDVLVPTGRQERGQG